ncbi:nickel-dependent putative hexonate epimerase [Breznakiellaceae bacterium SP9]
MVLLSDDGLNDEALKDALHKSLEGKTLRKVLLLPPDYTRLYSGAGKITALYYKLLEGTAELDVMPALGTHEPMSAKECETFFEGAIPFEKLLVHNWRSDVLKIGEVPAAFVSEVSCGRSAAAIEVEVNKRIMDSSYDLIISVGQVVPHEVVGMANYSKNIFVGCGGYSMINASHMLSVRWGIERLMGKDFSPVRKVFDYAEEHFLKNVPLLYVLTVCTTKDDAAVIRGLYIGRERSLFEQAVRLSQELNLVKVDRPLKKVVVYLDPREFRSTWLGNKAIYRVKMAIARGGELVILAPGVRKFGEDEGTDALIRKYGYVGQERVLSLMETCEDLGKNMSAAAHLIHGSSDGKFRIVYCTKELSEAEVRGVAFDYMPYAEAAARYDIRELKDGYNTVAGEEIYYISNPALGLWTSD